LAKQISGQGLKPFPLNLLIKGEDKMGEIINFNKDSKDLSSDELASVQMELREECKEKLLEVSNFINDLPLSHADNDKLVVMLTSITNQVMKDAFLQGFGLGVKVPKEG
jgi:hypothetical protein